MASMNTKSVLLEDAPFLLIAELKPVGDGTVTDLVCRWYAFQKQNAQFAYVCRKSISQAMNYADTNIYGCKHQILDSGRGFRRPYFCLTTKRKKGDSVFSLVTLFTTSCADDSMENFRIQTLANATCDSASTESFRFMDGPRLTWRGEKYLYFLTRVASTGKFNLTQLRMRKMVKDHVQEAGTVEFLDMSDLESSYLVLLVCRTENKFLFFEVDSLDSKVTLKDSPIPNKYAKNLKKAELFSEKGALNVLLVNRENEVFLISDGRVKTKLKLNETPNFLFMYNHMIIETRNEVKIFNRGEISNPISTFRSYPTVIGDFASRGSDQLLLLAEKPANQNAIGKYILTDFGVVYYDTTEACSEATSDVVSASMRTFSSAVESRIQISLKWLVESENELQRKIDHIRQSCENINRMAVDAETKDTNISLVPFLNSNNNNNNDEVMDTSKREIEFSLEVLRTWQLVVLGRLCIGVQIRASADIDAMSVGLVPKEEFSNSCSVCRCVKNQDGVWNVVCATEPPSMVRSEMTCDLMVHCLCGNTPRAAVCDKIVLKSSEIRRMLDHEITLNLNQTEVVDALSAIQQTVNLDIQSECFADHDDVFSLFQRLGFHSNDEKSGYHGDWFYPKMTGALGAMRARELAFLPGKSIVEVHYKDRAQLLCFIHSSYELLGDESTIRRHHGDIPVAMESESPMESEAMYDSDVIFDEP